MCDMMATLKRGGEAASRRDYRAELIAERLTSKTELASMLSVRDGDQLVCIDKVEGPSQIRIASSIVPVGPALLLNPDHHRLAKRDSVKVDDLNGETLLLLEDGHCLRDQALEVCSRVDLHEKQDFRATSLETLRQMVATGAGVTLLPELASRGAYGHARGVTIRPFTRPAPVRHVGGVWRKTSARRPAIDAMCKIITDHAK